MLFRSLSAAEDLQRMSRRFSLALYLGAIVLIAGVLTASLMAKAHADAADDVLLALIGILSLIATSQLATALVNRLATSLAAPHPLPRLDFSLAIPPQYRTLAVVPAMLASAAEIEDLVEALEVRFLANRDENLHFGLLTDDRDADQETLPEEIGRAHV